MKIKITLKDPDGFYKAIQDAAIEESIRISNLDDAIDEDMIDQIQQYKEEELEEFLSRWVEYGEYITIEFDTETGITKVLER